MGNEPTAPSQLDPKTIFLSGIGVGGLLLVVGLIFFLASVPIWDLTICTGLGVILATFGTQAKVKYRGWTIAGSGAIVVILYGVIKYFGITPVTDIYIHGRDPFKIPQDYSIQLTDKQPLLGAFRNNRFEFIIRGSRLENEFMKIEMNEEPLRVRRKHVDPHIQRQGTINWFYDPNRKCLYDLNGKAVDENCIQSTVDLRRVPGLTRQSSFSEIFITGVRAQSKYRTPATKKSPYKVLIENLSSYSAALRQSSREQLIAHGPEAIRPILDAYANVRRDDKLGNGLMAALAGIYRSNSHRSDEIRKQLTDTDFATIANATGAVNPAQSGYAAEFLYGLSDPRAITAILSVLEQDGTKKERPIQVLSGFMGDPVITEYKGRIQTAVKKVQSEMLPEYRVVAKSIVRQTSQDAEKSKPYCVVLTFSDKRAAVPKSVNVKLNAFAGDELVTRPPGMKTYAVENNKVTIRIPSIFATARTGQVKSHYEITVSAKGYQTIHEKSTVTGKNRGDRVALQMSQKPYGRFAKVFRTYIKKKSLSSCK